MVLKAMKYVTTMTYRWALGWGRREDHRTYELTFNKRCVADERRDGLR